MKKQYKAPLADALKMYPLTPLAVEQSINGDWGPGGGEAGAKDTSLDIIDDEEPADEPRTLEKIIRSRRREGLSLNPSL